MKAQSRLNVLVVDDDRLNINALNHALRDEFRIRVATSGKQALAVATSYPRPDLILLDIVIPDLDGFEVCKRLKADPETADIPVIFVTSCSSETDEVRGLMLGGNDFISRPVPPEVVRARVRNQVNHLLEKREFGRAGQLPAALSGIAEPEGSAGRRRSDQFFRREQNALRKELQDTLEQLSQMQKMASLGELAAGIIHEINSPVSYIGSNLKELELCVHELFEWSDGCQGRMAASAAIQSAASVTGPPGKQAELERKKNDILELIRESGEGVAGVKRIIQDLKTFSHPGPAEWQSEDIHKWLDSSLNIVNNKIKHKARLVKEYGDMPNIECLPSQLSQVFVNLLVNAAQSIEKYGEITVRTRQTDPTTVSIEISDTGSGIEIRHLEQIFDPFFTTRPAGTGTGLGLSLTSDIVRKHHGHIEADSKPGSGTTFRISLPINQCETGSDCLDPA